MQFFAIDLDELDELERRLPLFAVNRFGAVALRDRDHLFHPLEQGLVDWVEAQGVALGPAPRVLLLTNLAVLGYVFNPVSFYTLYRSGEAEAACVVAEISSTFGETLPTLLRPGNAVPSTAPLAYRTPKRLHVSPFLGLDQESMSSASTRPPASAPEPASTCSKAASGCCAPCSPVGARS